MAKIRGEYRFIFSLVRASPTLVIIIVSVTVLVEIIVITGKEHELWGPGSLCSNPSSTSYTTLDKDVTSVVGWKMAPQTTSMSIPRTCECYLICKKDLS